MTANVCLATISVTDLVTVQIGVTNLCVVLKHSLTVQMEDVLNGIHGVMEIMTVETTATKMNVQVVISKIHVHASLSIDIIIVAFSKGSNGQLLLGGLVFRLLSFSRN